MGIWNDVEVHSEDSADHGGGRQETGYNSHNLHHLIKLHVNVIDIQVLHAHHNITIVFAKVKGLHDMVIYILEILGGAVFQQFAFTPDNAPYQVSDRGNVSFQYNELLAQLVDLDQRSCA